MTCKRAAVGASESLAVTFAKVMRIVADGLARMLYGIGKDAAASVWTKWDQDPGGANILGVGWIDRLDKTSKVAAHRDRTFRGKGAMLVPVEDSNWR